MSYQWVIRVLLFFFATLEVGLIHGQSIWSNPITGNDPGLSNPYTTGDAVDMDISVSGIGSGVGVTGNAGDDRYNARGWNSNSFNIGDYFSFTLTPNDKYKITFGSFVYSAEVSGTGPSSFVFRSSLDGFTVNLGSPTSSGATIDLSSLPEIKYPSSIEFRLYAWGASTGNGTFSVNSFSFNAAIALPVNLISFAHQLEQNHVILNWSTATEKNNDYMAIERSVDANNFSEIGRVKGGGSSLERIDYSFVDRFPYQGTNYYRLRQVDYDGTVTFHKVIAVEFTGESVNTLGFVPTAEGFQVQFRAPGTGGSIILVDATGRILRTQKFDGQTLGTQISMAELPRGFYVLQVRRDDGKVEAWPLVK